MWLDRRRRGPAARRTTRSWNLADPSDYTSGDYEAVVAPTLDDMAPLIELAVVPLQLATGMANWLRTRQSAESGRVVDSVHQVAGALPTVLRPWSFPLLGWAQPGPSPEGIDGAASRFRV